MPTLSEPVSDRDHIQGPADAPMQLVEYGDYECPACGQAYPIIKAVQAQLGDKLSFVFRNFPLPTLHPHAEAAAEAAEAAGALGQFWPMHDTLYEHQRHLTNQDLERYARDVGVDGTAFQADLTQHKERARVEEDVRSGIYSGVNGTPTFFINGTRYDGSYDNESLIEALRQGSGAR